MKQENDMYRLYEESDDTKLTNVQQPDEDVADDKIDLDLAEDEYYLNNRIDVNDMIYLTSMEQDDLVVSEYNYSFSLYQLDVILEYLKNSQPENFDEISLKLFQKEIGKAKYKPLSYWELDDLLEKIKDGFEAGSDILFNRNVRLTRYLAWCNYKSGKLVVNDLISEAMIALYDAINKFDFNRSCFRGYIGKCIKYSVINYNMRYGNTIYIPSNSCSSLIKILRCIERFLQVNEREPTLYELSKMLDIPLDIVRDIMNAHRDVMSIDAFFEYMEDPYLADQIFNDLVQDSNDEYTRAEEVAFYQADLEFEVRTVLNKLSEIQRNVVKMYFGIDSPEMDLREISKKYSLSRERIRQILNNSILKLKRGRFISLRKYLGN